MSTNQHQTLRVQFFTLFPILIAACLVFSPSVLAKSKETDEPVEHKDKNWMEVTAGVANNLSRFTRFAFSGQFDTAGVLHSVELGYISRLPLEEKIFDDQLKTMPYTSVSRGWSGGKKWSMWQIDGGLALIYTTKESCTAPENCELKSEFDIGIPVTFSWNFGRYVGAGFGFGMMIYDDGVVTTVDLNLVLGKFN